MFYWQNQVGVSMMMRWNWFKLSSALVGLLVSTGASAAPQATDWGSISAVSGGWAEDTMAVYINVALVNPGGCLVTNGGYATLPTDPGRDVYHTLALAALLNNREVSAIVDGCAFSKPRLIGLSVR